jgi:UPF0755 protein
MKRLLFFFLLCVAAGAGFVLFEANQPYQGFTDERFIDYTRGTSTESLAATLQSQGVVRQSWLFLAARALSPGTKLQAGEYRFDHASSPFDVLHKIARGDIFYMEVTIPEGQNIFDVAANVAKLKIFSEEEFLKNARDPALIHDLDPQATSLEGYLWPDTYRVVRTTTPAQLCLAMTRKFRATWKTIGAGTDVHQIVTLASLVEREARIPVDRPLVASVFTNRLKQGIKLDCDPTTVYAALLEGRYRGAIHRSDLDSENPYNTYQHAGLPPGPIANPGLNAIKAALAPADTKYLYFVAKSDGSGGHNFSETLSQHNAAAAEYRDAQRAGKGH